MTWARLWELLRRGQGVARLERAIERLERRAQESQASVEARFSEHRELLGQIELRSNQTHDLLASDVLAILTAVVREDAENRRRLWRVREQPDYEAPFIVSDPLVSVVIPTYDRPELLTHRALPSVLAQTHENLEVLVIGDNAAPEVGRAVASLDDPRVSYWNLTQRLPAHPDPHRQWLIGSVMGRNEGMRRAQGDWVFWFDDDDVMYPQCVQRLLGRAREDRVEVAYGRLRMIRRGASALEVGEFPPRLGQFGWQAAVCHRGLRFFERELYGADLGLPGDALVLERMLRAGVRFAIVPDVLGELHPSRERH